MTLSSKFLVLGLLSLAAIVLSASTAKIRASLISSAPIASASTLPNTPPKNKKIPIIVYHHVRSPKLFGRNTWSWILSVSPDVFEKQLQWMDDHHYTTIDLSTYVQIMKGERAGPEKPIVITFDDNNESQYTDAMPKLLNHHMTAVFYIITHRIDQKTFLTKDQIKDMSAKGMDIESHTATHAMLSMIGTTLMDKELKESKKTLEEITGKPVLHIAYPLTAQNATVRQHARDAGYITGTIMDPRTATEKDDFLKLPRITLNDGSKLEKLLP